MPAKYRFWLKDANDVRQFWSWTPTDKFQSVSKNAQEHPVNTISSDDLVTCPLKNIQLMPKEEDLQILFLVRMETQTEQGQKNFEDVCQNVPLFSG